MQRHMRVLTHYSEPSNFVCLVIVMHIERIFGIKCIKCNGTDVVRDGIERNNRQRFLCRICKEIWSISKTDCEVFARFIDYRLEVCRYILSTLLKRKQTKEIKHGIDEISGIISHLTRIK
jgi:hypothetical protein